MPIPDELIEPFQVLNEGRRSLGRPPFEWNDCLYAIALELAEYAWKRYNEGHLSQKDAHWQFLERGERHGWVDSQNRGEYGVSGQSEGDWPKDRDGWRHPPKTAERHVLDALELLLKLLPRNEGHVLDFEGDWTHAAIAVKEGIFIIEYGRLPQSPDDVSFY